MKKLLISLLEAKGFANAETLYEIAEATGNVQVAIEKMTGMYVAPIVPEQAVKSYDGMFLAKLISYNPFTETVKVAGKKCSWKTQYYEFGKSDIKVFADNEGDAKILLAKEFPENTVLNDVRRTNNWDYANPSSDTKESELSLQTWLSICE